MMRYKRQISNLIQVQVIGQSYKTKDQQIRSNNVPLSPMLSNKENIERFFFLSRGINSQW